MADRVGLPFEDTADFEDAERGLVDAGEPVIRNEAGEVVWDNGSYSSFLTGDAPGSVHPSLWRQSTLVAKQGLFEVTDGIYQVRGYDLSNMSVIESASGDRPVVAVIHTHSHVDHFGGVKGVVSQDNVDAGSTLIVIGGHYETICQLGSTVRMAYPPWPSSARRLAALERGLASLEVVR